MFRPPSGHWFFTAIGFSGALLAAPNVRAQSTCTTAASVPTAPVHIVSDKSVLLQLRDTPRTYRTLCAAPCDMAVPLGATYRITGDGIRASDDFELQGTCGDPINLEVHARARGTFIGGIVMMSVGGATISSAFLYLLLAGFGDDPNARDRGGREQPDALAFGIAIGVGAGLIAAGLPVTLTNRRSLVMTPGERIEPAGGGMTAAAGVRRAPDSVLITPISISF